MMLGKHLWKIVLLKLISLTICLGGEQCCDSEMSESSTGTCGCGATSRKSTEAPAAENGFSDKGSDESLSESPAFKYSRETNTENGSIRTYQMVEIPGGKFVMGTNDPVFPPDGEHPARWVEMDTFYMDIYEVTNGEFERFLKATNYKTEVSILIVINCERVKIQVT